MDGVDSVEKNISLYRTQIRVKKWYYQLLSHCPVMAVPNAWQLYRIGGRKISHGLGSQWQRQC